LGGIWKGFGSPIWPFAMELSSAPPVNQAPPYVGVSKAGTGILPGDERLFSSYSLSASWPALKGRVSYAIYVTRGIDPATTTGCGGPRGIRHPIGGMGKCSFLCSIETWESVRLLFHIRSIWKIHDAAPNHYILGILTRSIREGFPFRKAPLSCPRITGEV
jgi:hypothetical protein